MKIIVVHGDDIEKSYSRITKFITEATKRGWEIVNDSIEDTPSLFGLQKLIIIRDFKKIGKKELDLIMKIEGYVVIYHQGNIPQTFLKILPKDTKFEKYDLPIILWKFLDSFNIDLFHQLLKTNAVEYIFAMISWKLKQKYIKNPTPKHAELISKLSEIDIKTKTSNLDLKLALELFILKNLIP